MMRFATCFVFALCVQTVSAQATVPTSAFIVRLGNDTTAVERYTRTGNSYSIEQVVRSPTASLRRTHLELTPSGDVATIFLMRHSTEKPAGPLLGSTKLTARVGDSAAVEIRSGDSVRTRAVALRHGLIPSLPQSFLPYELAAMRVRAAGADSMSVTLLSASGDTTPILARRIGADSMTFRLPFFTFRARVDADGRILGLQQPLGITVERVADVDVNNIANAWAALDRSGKAMGVLSPADSLAVQLGKARIAVKYSRPRTRGRVVFGNIAAWDSVWRTGANAATVFTTDRDLEIGGVAVPRGSYTLFTIPSRTGTTLIISKETMRDSQPLAGTDYDRTRDLARIPMTTITLDAPVEQFTIAIVPQRTDRGELRLSWDRRRMSVPVRIR